MKCINRNQLLALHAALVRQTGGSEGLRDEGLLDSAFYAPFQTYDGVELYPSITAKAVRLGYGLVRNHPFVDGNKRIGTHAMLVVLDMNGISLQYEDQDLIDTILHVADGTLDYQGLLRWVLRHIL